MVRSTLLKILKILPFGEGGRPHDFVCRTYTFQSSDQHLNVKDQKLELERCQAQRSAPGGAIHCIFFVYRFDHVRTYRYNTYGRHFRHVRDSIHLIGHHNGLSE